MRRLFNSKRFIFIFGLSIGVIIMASISYGINSIQSSSVSYTKDGKVMSVEQAIDDLIVKVNTRGSGSVFNITLREQKMSVSGSTTTTWLKGFIDETLNTMFSSINNLKEVNTDELTKLKNGNYTWSSSDTNVVIIEGTTVTPKRVGNVNVIATTDGGASVTIPLVISENLYLADVVSVGDYVAYDAGTWTSTADKPTSQGGFGGYTSGHNKGETVSGNAKGWRVMSIDDNNKLVTIVHAGSPEYYYHELGAGYSCSNGSLSVTNLNNRAASQYLNNSYATSAHNINIDEISSMPNKLSSIDSEYWLASAFATGGPSSSCINQIKFVSKAGSSSYDYASKSLGVRPVVVLKSNILTTGKGTDMVGQTAWTLVKP